MYSLTIENKDGLQLEFNSIGAAYNITNAQGLSPAKNTINTNSAALIDGGTFNSAKVNMRTINLAFTIEYPVEANRLNVYKVLRAKEPITIYYQSNALDVFIEGYVESLDVGHFEQKQKATVAILCPFPYWKNAQEVINELSSITDMFHFPFPYSPVGKNLLENTASSGTSSGITFTVNSDGSVTVNGTATANAYLVIGAVYLQANQTYILNGCPSGGGRNTYRLYWQGVSGNYDEGEGTSYTPTATGSVNIRMVIYEGATVNNLTFYPMVRFSSVTDDSWQPFSVATIVFGAIDTEAKSVVVNNGGITTGVTFELYAKEAVTNPKIFDYITQDYIGLNFSMEAGDLIIINTMTGQKSVTLIRNAVETNIFNSLQKGSTWLQLAAGGSVYVYQVDSGSLQSLEVDIKHYDLYEGV